MSAGTFDLMRRTQSAIGLSGDAIRSLPALVVSRDGPFGGGIGCALRRDRHQLAAAVLDGGVLELVVLPLGVERDARTGRDIVDDVGRTDPAGHRLRIAPAPPLVATCAT